MFSNCHLYFLISQFPVFLVFLSFILLLIIYFPHLSRFLHSSSFLRFSRLSCFLHAHFAVASFTLLLPFTLNFFVFFARRLFLLFIPCSTRSTSSHSAVLFSLDCILYPFYYPHPSRLPCFFLVPSFPPRTYHILLSNSEAAVVLVCIPRVPLRTR